MHELALTEALLAAALAAAQKQPPEATDPPGLPWRIGAVHLRVGALTGVVPDCMRFYFAQLAAGTPAADAELLIEVEPALATCSVCGARERATLPLAPICAHCGGALTISGGQALLLERLLLVSGAPEAEPRVEGAET